MVESYILSKIAERLAKALINYKISWIYEWKWNHTKKSNEAWRDKYGKCGIFKSEIALIVLQDRNGSVIARVTEEIV